MPSNWYEAALGNEKVNADLSELNRLVAKYEALHRALRMAPDEAAKNFIQSLIKQVGSEITMVRSRIRRWREFWGPEKPNLKVRAWVEGLMVRMAQTEEQASWMFSHPDRDGFLKLPVVYIRFGDLPTDEHGNLTPSMNGFRGKREEGISVYPAYYDPMTKKYILSSGNEVYLTTQGSITEGRPAFIVTGKEIGRGYDDGEPVLDPKTVKVIRKINSDDIVFEDTPRLTMDGRDLPEGVNPRFRPEHVSMFPDNQPLMTDEEKAERQRQWDEARERQANETAERHRQFMESLRYMAQHFPEHADAIYKQYPNLRPA